MRLYRLLCNLSAAALFFLLILQKVHSGIVLKIWSKWFMSMADRLLNWMSSKCNFQLFLSSEEMEWEERELSLQSRILSSFLTSWRSLSPQRERSSPRVMILRVLMFLKGWAVPEDPLGYKRHLIAFTKIKKKKIKKRKKLCLVACNVFYTQTWNKCKRFYLHSATKSTCFTFSLSWSK